MKGIALTAKNRLAILQAAKNLKTDELNAMLEEYDGEGKTALVFLTEVEGSGSWATMPLLNWDKYFEPVPSDQFLFGFVEVTPKDTWLKATH